MAIIKFLTSKLFLKQLIIAVVGVVVLIFALMKWLDSSTNHDQKIQVPDLSKMNFVEVTQVLDELDLRAEIIDSTNYNPEYPPLSVIEQSPEAGDFVKENRRIYLKINRPTYQDILIPNILTKPRRNAEATLKAVGFRVGTHPTYVKDIALDVVRGIYHQGKLVDEGSKLPRNSLLELKLGNGGNKELLK